jgi:hypothetical protein
MTKEQLEHILRASMGITGANQFVVIGSQSILGSHLNAPPELTLSGEVDLFTFRDPSDADLIDGSIGELSPFHQTFHYYAHGVSAQTAVLPDGWKDRLVRFETPGTKGAVGLCLEPHDLAVSKLVAGREKDLHFVAALIRHKLTDSKIIEQRINLTPLSPELLQAVQTRLGIALRNSTPS